MSRHLYPDCTKCPYFLSVDKIAKLKATIESQQQEINNFKIEFDDAMMFLKQEIKQKDEALRLAREALEQAKIFVEDTKCRCDEIATCERCIEISEINEALAEIDKALGGNENGC